MSESVHQPGRSFVGAKRASFLAASATKGYRSSFWATYATWAQR